MLNWTHCLNDFMNINIHIQLSVFSFSAATGALSAGGCNPRAKRGQEEPPHVRGQVTGNPHKVLLDFNPPFSLITPQSLGEQQWEEKGIEKF